MLGSMACSQVSVTDYASFEPVLLPEDFFSGDLTAHGVLKNRSGKVTRLFNATIKASWEDGVGTLDEHFLFDDGEKQQRVWTLNPLQEGYYRATANDVVGEGLMQAAGNSLFLDYILDIQYKGRSLKLHVDDRMYLVDEQTLVNESVLRKWGFKVGSILIVIKKSS